MVKRDIKIGKVLERMGNNVVLLVGIARNMGMDYREIVNLLGADGFKEPMQLRDRLTAEVRTKGGEIKLDANGQPMIRDSGWSINGLTNAGFAEVAGLLLTDVGGTAFDYIAIGTGTTAFDATQTALVAETHREAGTGSRETTTVTNDTAVLTHTFSGYTGSEAVTESGAFNDVSAGTMLCRQTFSALNIDWDAGDSLAVTWKVQAKQGT